MNSQLMLAILAMDAYNQGDQGDVSIKDVDGPLGNATRFPTTLPEGSAGYGFSAQAYIWNGQMVISFRGTDDFDFCLARAKQEVLSSIAVGSLGVAH